MKISWFIDREHQFDTTEDGVPLVGALVYIRDYTQPRSDLSAKKYTVERVDHAMAKTTVDLRTIKEGIKNYPEMQFSPTDSDTRKIFATYDAAQKYVLTMHNGHIYDFPMKPEDDAQISIVKHGIEVILKPVEPEKE